MDSQDWTVLFKCLLCRLAFKQATVEATTELEAMDIATKEYSQIRWHTCRPGVNGRAVLSGILTEQEYQKCLEEEERMRRIKATIDEWVQKENMHSEEKAKTQAVRL